MTEQVEKKVTKKETVKPNHKYMRDKDREMVKGVFRFYEVPGGSMSFCFRAYKEDQVERYDLVDGQVYTLPVGVAKHLNKNTYYPVHQYQQDKNGNPTQKIGQKVYRCGFQSLEFLDVDELEQTKQIITVENVG